MLSLSSALQRLCGAQHLSIAVPDRPSNTNFNKRSITSKINKKSTTGSGKGVYNLLHGIMRYKRDWQINMLDHFQAVRDNPDPKAVFVTCVDSR